MAQISSNTATSTVDTSGVTTTTTTTAPNINSSSSYIGRDPNLVKFYNFGSFNTVHHLWGRWGGGVVDLTKTIN